MKTVTAALAIALAAPLPAGAQAQPSGNPVVDTVWRLCAPNHAIATDVLTAAAASGWGPLSPAGRAQVGNRFTNFTASFLEKRVGGVRLLLIVGESPEENGQGNVRRRCWVESERPSSPEAMSAIRAYLGSDPNITYQTTYGWIYVEINGQRVFVKDGEPMPAGADTMHLVMTTVGSPNENVGYNESGPPTH